MIEQINGYTPINKRENFVANKTDNVENAELFKKLLSRAVQGDSADEDKLVGAIQGDTVKNKRGIEMLSEISVINDINLTNSLSEIENETEELIEKLDIYSSQLESPKVSLKEINTLIEEIKVNAENLLQKAHNSDTSSQELIDIVSECAIAAHSEYIKFQRGDYLDSFA